MKIKDEVSFIDNGNICVYRLYFLEIFSSPHTITIRDVDSNKELYHTNVESINEKNINDGFHYYWHINSQTKNISVTVLNDTMRVWQTSCCVDYEKLNVPTVLIERPMGYAGMGDYFFSIPSITKLSKTFGKKIDVITRHPQIFVNNPYIENLYELSDNENIVGIYEKYSLRHKQRFFELMPNHNNTQLNPNVNWLPNLFLFDIRQSIAKDCGFQLTHDELNIEFFPNPFMHIDLPEKYVVINPYISGVDRDFGKNNWQKIVDELNDKGIPVVAIGMPNKFHDVNIRLGINLCGHSCQSNLSQTWHIINRSMGFVTFDTGIYVLSGTTDAQIFLIDTYLNPEWHAPYRNGSNKYKLTVIKGGCQEYCLSNLKYYNVEKGKFFQPPVQKCALNYDSFKCMPSPEKISKTIIDYWFSL